MYRYRPAVAPSSLPASPAVNSAGGGSRQLVLVPANRADIESGGAAAGCVCSICTNLLSDPVQTACKHVFCSRCINRWISDAVSDGRMATCPMGDSRELTVSSGSTSVDGCRPLSEANPQLFAQLSGVNVQCPLARLDGCNWVGAYSAALRHQQTECPRAWVLCPLSAHGCTERFRRSACADHMTSAALAHVSLLSAKLDAWESERSAMLKQVG